MAALLALMVALEAGGVSASRSEPPPGLEVRAPPGIWLDTREVKVAAAPACRLLGCDPGKGPLRAERRALQAQAQALVLDAVSRVVGESSLLDAARWLVASQLRLDMQRHRFYIALQLRTDLGS